LFSQEKLRQSQEKLEDENQKGLPVSGAVGREKAIQLCNFYTGLLLRRRAASMPVRDSLKMLVQCEE
jgi:hypothetical protein